MKIAIVRQTYKPNGGAELFVSNLLNTLMQNTNFDITLITRRWKDAIRCKKLIVNPYFLNRVDRESRFAAVAISHFDKFDIVQSHERIPGATIFRAGDGIHATWLEQYIRILSPIKKWIQPFSCYHSYILKTEVQMFTHPHLYKVICNSKMVRDDIVRRFALSKDKVSVIYNGVNTTYFSPQVRELSQRSVLDIPPNSPVLAYVGSGFDRKGVATALQAIMPHPSVWLIIAGKDKNAHKFKKLANILGIASRVRFVGSIIDIRQIYGTADALILPTLYDPFPNVCIEALACGLPIFTSHNCGIAEWIEEGKNGWVNDALDIAGFQQAISDWLEGRKQGVDYSAVARATAEPYTLSRMVRELKAVYLRFLR